MPPIEGTPMAAVPEGKSNEEVAAAKPVIGIIYPPPEVRNIVDKTASFVARNGPEFESRIRQNEVNNPKFNFLNPSDPYHAYYQHKVKEFKEGRGQEPSAPKFGGQSVPGLQKPMLEQARIIDIPIIPTEPPAEFEFVADPPSISAFDLDVVKLTAQFVARNGRQFLTNLMNREQRNYQFDFLRPQHSLFNYFTKLVEQYTKILIPPKDLLAQLKSESDDYHKVLNQVKYRVEWAKYQERERRKEAEAIERERVAYAQVDWHDFVVVETVDFQPSEQGNLPPPTTPSEVGARVLAQERIDRGEVDEGEEMEVESDDEEEVEIEKNVGKARQTEIELQDMDESSSSADEDEEELHEVAPPQPPAPAPPPPPPPSDIPAPPLPPMPDQVVVRKDYDPKAKALPLEDTSDQYLVSPITGEKIPAHKVQEHMRIGLLDPKWIEARKRTITEKRDQEEVFAPGSAIESSLKMLAERRTDIFGAGVEETQIGKKIGEEEKKEKKVVWDGHTASMEKVTQKARENITIEEQIAVIHKVKGLLPDEEKEKIGPAIPKQPPPPKAAPPPPPPKSQPPPPQAPKLAPVQKMPPRPPQQQHMPQPLMQQPRGGLMVLPPRPPMPLGIHPQMHMPQHMMPHGPPHPPNYPPSLMGNRPPGPPHKSHHPPPPSMEDEPMAKKQKTEDQLVPEGEFLKRNKGPVTFKVVIPKVTEKAEWKLNGQTLSFTLPLTDTISVMKAKLNESLGLPAGKQKLQYEGIFMKDSNSLAYYNFMKGATVQLQLKERGGRKK
ncbi:splicing factor 3A subunit 1-like [Ylistrum balloti]|uniref:splicing factor 3A subunit 1-like n=1 Tax=Ylistrum balloti TaxID=509963 RepID=UPI002905DBFF|nr:splicing factor 3A subunit 1-like [Ylistrum balloti]